MDTNLPKSLKSSPGARLGHVLVLTCLLGSILDGFGVILDRFLMDLGGNFDEYLTNFETILVRHTPAVSYYIHKHLLVNKICFQVKCLLHNLGGIVGQYFINLGTILVRHTPTVLIRATMDRQ